jgi:putative Ca2+/H+ antiporter (TMEM165/GDT1 family)
VYGVCVGGILGHALCTGLAVQSRVTANLIICCLAAREDVYGVCVGGILGHALCTGLAVLGGRIIATRISVRTVTLVSQPLPLQFLF